jgi:hypothetical protein
MNNKIKIAIVVLAGALTGYLVWKNKQTKA